MPNKSKPSVNDNARALLRLLNRDEPIYTPDTVPEGFISPEALLEAAGEGASWNSIRESLRNRAAKKQIERVLVKCPGYPKPRHWYRPVQGA